MFYRIILIFSLIITPLKSFEQKKGFNIESSVDYNFHYREFFNKYYLGNTYRNWNFNLGFGYGVNTLLNTSRLFYSIPVSLNKSFNIGKNSKMAPLINFSLYGYKSVVRHTIFCFQIGYEFTYGHKLKFVQRLSGGTNLEQYKGNSHSWNLFILNAEFSLGLKYEL